MFRRSCLALAFLLGLHAAPLRAQFIEVQVRSVDDVLAAARYLAPIVKAEELLKVVDSAFGKDDKGLAGVIDTARPLGFTMEWPQGSKTPDEGTLYIPVRDAKTFPERVKKLPIPWRPVGKELYELTLPHLVVAGPVKLFGRLAGDHVFLSPSRPLLMNPERLKAPASKPMHLARATLHVAKLPKFVRDEFIKGFEEELLRDERLPGEPDALQRRRLLLQSQRAFFAAIVNSTHEISATVDLDVKQPRLVAEVALVPQPDSALADAIKTFGAGRSLFGGVHRQALVSFTARVTMAEMFALQPIGASLLDELEKTVDPQERLFARRMVRALEPTLKGGKFDLGAGVYAPTKEAPLRVLAGLHLQKGRTLESVARDLLKDTPAADRDYYGLEWHYKRHPAGPVHSLLWHARSDRRRPLFFTVRDDRALAATDYDLLGRALDELDRPPPADVAPVQLEVHLRAMMVPYLLMRMGREKGGESLLEDLGKGNFGAVIDALQRFANSPQGETATRTFAKMFPNAGEEDRRATYTVHGDAALRMRLELHPELLGVFRLFLPEV